MTAHVEAGLTRIREARDAASGSLSASGKTHWRGVADDEANRLGDLLQIRADGPVVPGKPVPPTERAIRRGLQSYQAIGAAMIEQYTAWAHALAAWGCDQYGDAERHASRSATAGARVDTLRARHPFGDWRR